MEHFADLSQQMPQIVNNWRNKITADLDGVILDVRVSNFIHRMQI